MDQNSKIIKLANNCTFLEGLIFEDANFCIKTMFLNSVLNRFKNYTQNDVVRTLSISKRTVASLEAGKVANIVTIFNYIQYFNLNFAQEEQKKVQRNYYRRNKYC